MEQLLHGLAGAIVAAAAAFAAFVKAADGLESALSEEALSDFSAYLTSPTLERRLIQLPDGTLHLFERLFGQRQLSLKCVLRSILFSLGAIAFFGIFQFLYSRSFFDWVTGLRKVHGPGDGNHFFDDLVLEFVWIWLLWALVADFLNLWKARVLVGWLSHREKGGAALLAAALISDMLFNYLSFLLSVALIVLFAFFTPSWDQFWQLFYNLVTQFLITSGPDASLNILTALFLAGLLPSLWLWIWLASTLLTRLASSNSRALAVLTYLLPLKTHPVRSLGLIAGSVFFVGFVGAALI